jgi:hypothetical protein
VASNKEGRALELGVAQGFAEFVQTGPRVGEDVGGIEGEEDLDIDIRRLTLLNELGDPGAFLNRDLPGLEVSELLTEFLLLSLALRRRRIKTASSMAASR